MDYTEPHLRAMTKTRLETIALDERIAITGSMTKNDLIKKLLESKELGSTKEGNVKVRKINTVQITLTGGDCTNNHGYELNIGFISNKNMCPNCDDLWEYQPQNANNDAIYISDVDRDQNFYTTVSDLQAVLDALTESRSIAENV